MKRRLFVKKFGQGISSSVFMPGIFDQKAEQTSESKFHYPYPQNLKEAENDDGLIACQLEISGTSKSLSDRLLGKIQTRKTVMVYLKSYFMMGRDKTDNVKGTFDLSAVEGDRHVLTIWLKDVNGQSEIICRIDGGRISIKIRDLLMNQEFLKEGRNYKIKANLLLYHEVGRIDPEAINIPDRNGKFRFIIMADPQGGDPYYEYTGSSARMKIHNAFVEESIITANALTPEPLFALILGDFTDHQGEEENFRQMIRYYKGLNYPMLMEIGNHETRYRSEFTPAYNMSAFNNYFIAQKQINGMEKLLYSFDLGTWHFVVWPDPLRSNFWETHPHYFDWLERDLLANRDRPTFFFQHVPIHPIGINPLVSYVNPVIVNRLLFDILSRHGNVKYVFSGHVHIPLRSSLKTAVHYRGMNLINLPPAGYRPRSFGEEDLYGGPCQGFCIVDVDGDNADVSFKTVTQEVLKYPDTFRDYGQEQDPLWFKEKWEIEAGDELSNGSFQDGLTGWMKKFVYREDDMPSNICEVRPAPDGDGKAVYLYVRRRDYDKPGQDRLPQTINQISQVVSVDDRNAPVISFDYRIDSENFDPDSWNGGFLWLEGYHRNHLMLNHVYAIGRTHRSIGGSYGYSSFTGYSFFDIFDGSDKWNSVHINLKSDYELLGKERSYDSLDLNKIVLSFGVWTINVGHRQRVGLYIRDVELNFSDSAKLGKSHLNNKAIELLENQKIFSKGIGHVAGEHRYVSQEEVYPY